jgi:hypothetical protein
MHFTEIWALLGYYAVSSGNSVPPFQDNLLVPSSRVKESKNKAGEEGTSWPLKMGPIGFPQNLGTELPLDAV